MKKKIIASVLALSMVAMGITGCGGSSSNSSTTSDSASGNGADASEESSANSDATYSVGVIQLVQHPALDAATEGFQDALKEAFGDDVTIDVQNGQGDAPTCATIANSFVSQNVNLIMSNATPALQAAMAATADIPIVGTSITDYATALDMTEGWSGTSGINVTGASDLAPLEGQADMINELFPDAKKVGILYCNAEPNSKYQASVITPALEALGYTVSVYEFSDSNDVRGVTDAACQASDVLYVPTDNTAASNTEIIDGVAAAAGVPIVAGEEGICRGCGVATLSISYYDMGYDAGKMAVEILKDGKNPADMEIKSCTTFTKEYDADRCAELGVEVPEDYVALEPAE